MVIQLTVQTVKSCDSRQLCKQDLKAADDALGINPNSIVQVHHGLTL